MELIMHSILCAAIFPLSCSIQINQNVIANHENRIVGFNTKKRMMNCRSGKIYNQVLASNWKILLFILSCIFFCIYTKAQTKKDSTISQREWFQKTLREREIQHLKDSIALDVLHSQLQKGNSSSEQKILRAKLDSLQAKDSLLTLLAKDSIDNLRANTFAVPVMLFADTIFQFYAPLGQYSAAQRAKDLETKINFLYNEYHYLPDSLIVQSHSDISIIKYKDQVIAGVSATDALWEQRSLDALSDSLVAHINTSVVYYQQENNWGNTLKRIGLALATILSVLVTIFLMNRIFIFSVKKLVRSKSKTLSEIKIKNYKIFSRPHLLSILIQILKVIRILILIVILYIGITLIFRIFPSTHQWSNNIISFVEAPLRKILSSMLHYLPNLIPIALIILVFRLITKILKYFTKEIERGQLKIKGFYSEWSRPTYNLVRVVLCILVTILIFPYLPGSGSIAFKGISVFVGILLSIGSSSAISNAVSGVVITYMRPFKIGDWVKVGEFTGYVIEKNLLVTRIRTLQNEDITLPNTTILNSQTVNYTKPIRDPNTKGLVVKVDVTLDYQTDWKLVSELLKKAALLTDGVLRDPEPFVLQQNLNDFNVAYQLNAYTLQPERMFFIHSDLLHHIVDLFKEADVNMISPQYINIKKD